MKHNGQYYRSICVADDGWRVQIIDQTRLPFEFELLLMETLEDAAVAIRDMQVRGAPLIGATAAYGVCLALRTDASDAALKQTCEYLASTRPTAINLRWALDKLFAELSPVAVDQRVERAYQLAAQICDDDVATNEAIGNHGFGIIQSLWNASDKSRPLNILTHCNAGWLACVDWGTALAPMYKAHDAGIPIHVWVDETRPRNQGASLTAFELGGHGIPHHVICDNAGGHYMQHGMVDLCIVGTDRTTRTGDVCNKIGTYLKALAAKANNVPFYVALPSSTVDWSIRDGVKEIPIEERGQREISHLRGLDAEGKVGEFQITAPGSECANPAFDVTPAEYVSGLITERGVCDASEAGLSQLFPELAS